MSTRIAVTSARRSRVVLTAGAALTLGLVLSACSSGPAAPAASRTTTTTTTAAAAAAAVADTIIIKNFMFSPAMATVRPGATVTVTNRDNVTHTLTSDSGLFTTGDVAAGTTTHFTAPTRAGTYRYRCDIHQFMTGTLRVS